MKKIILLILSLLFCISGIGCDDVSRNVTPTTITGKPTTMQNVATISTTQVSALQTTTQSATTKKAKKETKITDECIGMSIDYYFIKEFKTIKQYKKEFLNYKSFDDIEESIGYKFYPDNHLKINKSYASMMLKDKFFLVLNNEKLKLKWINFQLNWGYVRFFYELDSKEVVISYCVSKTVNKQNIDLCKGKPDIITENGCKLHLVKRTSPLYTWYNEDFKTIFNVESELFENKEFLKKCVDNLTVEKICII